MEPFVDGDLCRDKIIRFQPFPLLKKVEQKEGPFGRGLCPRMEQNPTKDLDQPFLKVETIIYYISIYKNEDGISYNW